MPTTCQGKLILVSGPSGAGKTTVLRKVFQRRPGPLVASVSATTRSPRPGEVHGVDYHFLTNEEFREIRRNEGFVECFEVFERGHWYGTLKQEVQVGLEAGKWVVLEIDVQGALRVIDLYEDAVSIFIQPSSRKEIERRLRGRGTETEEAVEKRLQQADEEIRLSSRYDYVVINDDIDRAVDQICNILTQESETNRNDP